MDRLIVFILILFIGRITAQTQYSVVGGQIFDETTNTPLQGVHIQNMETSHYATTDDDGKFFIKANKGNTLKITHIGKQTLHRIILESDLENNAVLFLKMRDEVTQLDEVEVVNQKITAQGLGILQHTPVERTFNEKREYANTKVFPQGVWPILLGQLHINFNALIYTISGKRKMFKQNVKNEKNLNVALHIKENFSDFLRKDLRLNEEEIDVLAYFVMEKEEFHVAISKESPKTLQFMLINAWIEYQNMSKE